MYSPKAVTVVLLALAVYVSFASANSRPGPEDRPLPNKVKGVPAKAAMVYPQPSGTQDYKYATVHTFPGTKFYSTYCGGPNVDREATITRTKIEYVQNRGPSGNSMKINYFFLAAKLQVIIKETYEDNVLVDHKYELSALLDDESDRQIQNYAAGARKAAISAIDTITTHLDKFSARNQEAACMAYITGPAKNPFQPYSPDLLVTIRYLKHVRRALANFRN